MKELHTLDEFRAHIFEHQHLLNTILQNIDLAEIEHLLFKMPVAGTIFLGCTLSTEASNSLTSRGAFIFPTIPNLPFQPYRANLYSPEDLFKGFDPEDPCSYCHTPDNLIYKHWQKHGKASPTSILEGILRRIHDQSITDALLEFLEANPSKTVAIMGGHAMLRTDKAYRDVAVIARALTRKGWLMVSGGGPGAMEATHLGAWFAERSNDDLLGALATLAKAPHYKDELWLAQAFAVREKWPLPGPTGRSLGIPTWLYGHEPPNPFATHIAKYFNNSLREDGLVTIAHDGIIFSPGSAGTLQEIFQDACQNHYATTGHASPMVFFGKKFWTENQPIYPLLREFSKGRPYHDLMGLCDTPAEVLEFLEGHLPTLVQKQGWNFCDSFCP